MFLPLHLFILFSKWEDSKFAVLQICKYVFYFFFFFSSGHCNLANYSQSQVLLDSNLVLQGKVKKGKVKTHDFSQKLQKGLFLSAYYKVQIIIVIEPNSNNVRFGKIGV